MRRTYLLLVAAAACSGGRGASDGGGDGGPDAPAPIVEPIHFIGRFDAQQRFAWPGTQIAARVHGTGASIDLDDGGGNWFEVVVDGAAQPPFATASGRQTYTLATGLPDGDHDVSVARRTESLFGVTTFVGLPGATLVPTARPARLIEFIGDSITCGYGVLGAGPNCSFSATTEAEPHAWGALAAAALGAAHVSIAYSGIGIARNNDGTTTDTMAARYVRTLADDAGSAWDWSYTPDVIVVNLGTNDFAPGDPGQAYVTAYTAFATQLRARFPLAWIFLATSPMLSDGYPAGAMQRTKARGYLDAIAAALADPRVRVVEIAEQLPADGYGCDYHPSEATARAMAAALVAAIRPLIGW